MNRSGIRAAVLLVPAVVSVLVGSALKRYERQESPRNSTRIVVYDQGYYKAGSADDRWALPGWDWGLSQQRSLATAGCHLISYAHAIQWITGDVRGDDLLDELLTVCKNPSDQAENSHHVACKGLHDTSIFSKEAYDAHLLSRYGIRTLELEKTPEALKSFFSSGGAIVTGIPGHYITALEVREIRGQLYVHIVDSNWGTARRKGYEMFFLEDDRLIRIFHTADGTYTDGSDYWISYDTYAQFNWKTPLTLA